ncbi:MAG: glycosyltransferase family 2 protein [Candidatus Margulisiibacteriota bacterium]
MIDLSIIIVNYNGEKLLTDCLRSIYGSTHKTSFEVILVDNRSTDNSLRLVKELFPKVEIIKNEENFGFCKANNQALRVYHGRYALLLNNDTIVKDKALDRMVEFMDAHPGAGACGPKLLNPDGTVQHQGGFFAREFWISPTPVTVNYLIAACLLIRRTTIDQVGLLDENFFFSNDDLDYTRRIVKAGWKIYFVPQAEVVHLGGYTINLFRKEIFVEGFRGGLYFCKKHYGLIAYQFYRWLVVFLLLPVILITALIYPWLKNKEKLTAYLEILRIFVKGELRRV